MTKEQFEKIMAQIWDVKYESDKIWLIIDKYTGKNPNDLLKEYRELGNNSCYRLHQNDIKWSEK